jgi:hypothetical protein
MPCIQAPIPQKKKKKERKKNGQKTHEEMINIPGHKENVNQNHIKQDLTPVRMATIKNTNNS